MALVHEYAGLIFLYKLKICRVYKLVTTSTALVSYTKYGVHGVDRLRRLGLFYRHA